VTLSRRHLGRLTDTETAPLEVEGKVPWKRIDDPTLFKGTKIVERFGAPPRKTSVTRRVYSPDGTLMSDTTWSAYSVGEPTVVRIGTKPRPKPPAKPPVEKKKPSAGAKGKDVTGPEPPSTPLP